LSVGARVAGAFLVERNGAGTTAELRVVSGTFHRAVADNAWDRFAAVRNGVATCKY
jgi:hypothetical protein